MEGDFVVINFFALVHLLNTLSFVPGLIVSALSRVTNCGSSACTFRKDGALQNFSKSVVW